MEMVVEWAAATAVAEMARAVTAAAMELVVRVAAAKAAVTGRVRTGRGAAAAKDQGILEAVMVAGGRAVGARVTAAMAMAVAAAVEGLGGRPA